MTSRELEGQTRDSIRLERNIPKTAGFIDRYKEPPLEWHYGLSHSPSNISDTVRDRGNQQEMPYGLSSGHVTDDVT